LFENIGVGKNPPENITDEASIKIQIQNENIGTHGNGIMILNNEKVQLQHLEKLLLNQ